MPNNHMKAKKLVEGEEGKEKRQQTNSLLPVSTE